MKCIMYPPLNYLTRFRSRDPRELRYDPRWISAIDDIPWQDFFFLVEVRLGSHDARSDIDSFLGAPL